MNHPFWLLVGLFLAILVFSIVLTSLRDKKPPSAEPTPLAPPAVRPGVSPREIVAVPERVWDIVGAYARMLETMTTSSVQPESRLPHPKPVIEEALNVVLATLTDSESAKSTRRCLRALQTFIPDREVPADPEEAAVLALFLLGRASAREGLMGALRSARAQRGPSGIPLCAEDDELVRTLSANGQVLRNSGQLEKAAAQYGAVIALFPDDRAARAELRDLYREKGDLGKSAEQSDALSLICRLDGDGEGATKYESEARQAYLARAQIEWRSLHNRKRNDEELLGEPTQPIPGAEIESSNKELADRLEHLAHLIAREEAAQEMGQGVLTPEEFRALQEASNLLVVQLLNSRLPKDRP